MDVHTLKQFENDLYRLGIVPGDTVMMHSSYRSLGGIEQGAKGLFDAFFDMLGENGTLILPAFSYDTVGYDSPAFDRQNTPSCVGFLPEFFRTSVPDVVRSMHATHSCSAKGRRADELTKDHIFDLTPVGKNSPIAKLPHVDGKILFLGCSPNHNTAMHGVEELVRPMYLFDDQPIRYVLKDGDFTVEQTAIRHSFSKNGIFYDQQYVRIIDLLSPEDCRCGKVLDAECYLLSAKAVWEVGYQKLLENPFYFVKAIPE